MNGVVVNERVFECMEDYILVEPVDAPTQTKGGIFLPQASSERPQEGIVRGCGPGAVNTINGQFMEMRLSVGDRVIYGKYSGAEMTIDGVKYLTMRQTDVIARLREFTQEERAGMKKKEKKA